MKYFFPLLFLMIAIFSIFAVYKYHLLAIEGVDLLANTIDNLGGSVGDSISSH